MVEVNTTSPSASREIYLGMLFRGLPVLGQALKGSELECVPGINVISHAMLRDQSLVTTFRS